MNCKNAISWSDLTYLTYGCPVLWPGPASKIISADATLHGRYFSFTSYWASMCWDLSWQHHSILSWVCLWDVNQGLCWKGPSWGFLNRPHSPHMPKPSESLLAEVVTNKSSCHKLLLTTSVPDLNIWHTIPDGNSHDASEAVVLKHPQDGSRSWSDEMSMYCKLCFSTFLSWFCQRQCSNNFDWKSTKKGFLRSFCVDVQPKVLEYLCYYNVTHNICLWGLHAQNKTDTTYLYTWSKRRLVLSKGFLFSLFNCLPFLMKEPNIKFVLVK